MRNLLLLAVVGGVAQLVDGSLGMGFGVTSSTLLLAAGIAPAAASAAIHLSEVGTTLASGLAHHRLGNVDWRTVGMLALPGGIGAFLGAHLLVGLEAAVAKPLVAGILFTLGLYVVWRFLVLRGNRPRFPGGLSARFLAPLGLFGGALDAFGGGGWGPVGTTALLASGRLEPRKVIGSVSTSEFVVALCGSAGFMFALGLSGIPLGFTLALMAGGVVAAPLAAWLVRHLAARVLGVAAGSLILLTNSKTVAESIGLAGLQVGILAAVVGAVGVSLVTVSVRQERAASRAALPDLASCVSPPSPTMRSGR